MTQKDWKEHAKNILRGEMKKRGISIENLSILLRAIGVEKTSKNISVTITNGAFSTFFFLQCLHAIGCDRLDIPDVLEKKMIEQQAA